MAHYAHMIHTKTHSLLFSLFVIITFISSAFLAIHVYATENDESLEYLNDQYDEAISEFDDMLDESGITGTISDIRAELRRDSLLSRSDAVELTLRGLRGDINELSDDGDEVHEDFLGLADQSRFEDLHDQVEAKAGELRSYIRNKVHQFRDEVTALERESDDADSDENRRSSEVRAPEWHWGEETDMTALNTQNNQEQGSGSAAEEVVVRANAPRERTSDEIQAEVQQMLARIQQLLAELTEAKQREATQPGSAVDATSTAVAY